MTTKNIYSTKWLSMFERVWRHNDQDHTWNYVSRCHTVRENCVDKKPDAVLIAAVLMQDEPRHILTAEYRVPIGGYELGFPAGLIGPNETAEEAATREFREETGLELKVGKVSPLNLYSTPGMTDESCQIVFGQAEGTPNPKFLEPSESIYTHLLTKQKILEIIFQDQPLGCIGWGCKAWPIVAAWAGVFGDMYE